MPPQPRQPPPSSPSTCLLVSPEHLAKFAFRISLLLAQKSNARLLLRLLQSFSLLFDLQLLTAELSGCELQPALPDISGRYKHHSITNHTHPHHRSQFYRTRHHCLPPLAGSDILWVLAPRGLYFCIALALSSDKHTYLKLLQGKREVSKHYLSLP